jgi:beta-glucosidase
MSMLLSLKSPTKAVLLGTLAIVCMCSVCFAQTDTKGTQHPWMNSSLSPDERASMVVKQMTLDEKISR